MIVWVVVKLTGRAGEWVRSGDVSLYAEDGAD